MHLASLLILALCTASTAFLLNGPPLLLAKSSGCLPLSFPACKRPRFSLPGLPSAMDTRWTDLGIFGPSEGIGQGFLVPHVDRRRMVGSLLMADEAGGRGRGKRRGGRRGGNRGGGNRGGRGGGGWRGEAPMQKLTRKVSEAAPGCGDIGVLLDEARASRKVKFSGRTYTSLVKACSSWRGAVDVLRHYHLHDMAAREKGGSGGEGEEKGGGGEEEKGKEADVKRGAEGVVVGGVGVDDRQGLGFACGAAVRSCERGSGGWEGALELSTMMREGGYGDVIAYGGIINACAKSKRWREAITVLKSMLEGARDGGAAPAPDVVCFNAAISACDRGGAWQEAVALLGEMEEARVQPDGYSIGTAMSACARAGSPLEAKLVMERGTRLSIPPNKHMIASLVNAFAARGDVQGAIAAFDEGTEAGVVPDDYVTNSLLRACSRSGDGDEALKVYLAAEETLCTNEVSLSTVLCALAGGGSDKLKAAEDLVERAEGRWPDGLLPGVCYLNLLDVAQEAGDSEAAARAQAKFREVGGDAVAAVATFTARGKDYEVVNGDKGGGDSRLAGAGLELVEELLSRTGYEVRTESLLAMRGSEAQKRATLAGHAEKTALGALLNRGLVRDAASPINIRVSIRMCRDCHLAFEFASSQYRRAITCDDGSTVHTFVGGACSCGGQWR